MSSSSEEEDLSSGENIEELSDDVPETRNQLGIEGYLKLNMEGNSCLEIVCGRGQWSKFIYNLYII